MILSERPQTRLWTRDEYNRAAEFGLFGPNERLELLNGDIVQKMSPQSSPHAVGTALTAETLRAVFTDGYYVREEKPLILSDNSEPEPDIVVMRGRLSDVPAHPTPATAALVVEVSDTTLAYDRGEKARAYARSGIAEYWIVNLRARCLEVYRDPYSAGEGEPGYHSVQIIPADGRIGSLEKPNHAVSVLDLLPSLQSAID